MPTATTTPIQERAEAVERVDHAFAHRDYEALYAALEDFSRASFEMGRAKGKWVPVFKEKPTRKAEPDAPKGEWTVGEVAGHLVSFKQGSTVFTVNDAAGRPVALCDNRANAEMIAEALSKVKP